MKVKAGLLARVCITPETYQSPSMVRLLFATDLQSWLSMEWVLWLEMLPATNAHKNEEHM
jgi:hypothetical protein